ncbi:Eri3 [Columba livia]|nr:Eri3 [Columba livia]
MRGHAAGPGEGAGRRRRTTSPSVPRAAACGVRPREGARRGGSPASGGGKRRCGWPAALPLRAGSRVRVRGVSDASGCSMIARLHTGAARFPQNLLPRARQAVCSLLPPGVLKGYSSIVSRKLASHGFGASMAAMSSFPPQRYHYFLVLDFEATCDKPQIHPQEIIEFPILKLNGRTMEIESTFHMYVQPVVHPQLTPFCTELTGIIQGMVDGQPSLQQVLERVDEWMAKEGLLDPSVKSIFVTCGDWDLKVMLPGQCQYLGLPVADYFKQWINLKKAYSFAMGSWPKNGLLDMNKGLNLQHIGRPHSGIDDCKNIANIMKTLAHRGFIFKQTSKPF